jgi:hypothetical protein
MAIFPRVGDKDPMLRSGFALETLDSLFLSTGECEGLEAVEAEAAADSREEAASMPPRSRFLSRSDRALE